jgi:hypothetical protein
LRSLVNFLTHPMELYYVLRSRLNGQFLVAHPSTDAQQNYVLVFKADYDALSYLNAHAANAQEQLATECLSASQLKANLSRWGFQGIGLVDDPMLPSIQFLELA